MRRVLHILTREPDPLSNHLLTPPPPPSQTTFEVFHLAGNAPDYRSLLEKIFQADSIAVD